MFLHRLSAPSLPFLIDRKKPLQPRSGASSLLQANRTGAPYLRKVAPARLAFHLLYNRVSHSFFCSSVRVSCLHGLNCTRSCRTCADMAYVWVQQWVALPIIVEEQQQMGDAPPDTGVGPSSRPSGENDGQQSALPYPQSSQGQPKVPTPVPPFHAQYPSFPQRIDPSRIPSQPNFGTINPPPGQQSHGVAFNMTAMAGALPDYGSGPANPVLQQQQQQQQQTQRRLSGASTPAVVYQLQQSLQYPQGVSSIPSPPSYGSFPPGQYGAFGQPSNQQPFGAYGSSPQRVTGIHQQFQPYQQLSPQQFYFAQGQQIPTYGPPAGQFSAPYVSRPSASGLSASDSRAASFGESTLEGKKIL